jgi:hypothetical protein
MRRLIFVFLIFIVAAGVWLWRGRELSMLIDRFKTIETSTQPIKSISYEGTGTGGVLHIGDVALSLNETQHGSSLPNVGTTKDGQLALSFGGKIFSFGSVGSDPDHLVANAPSDDIATLSIQQSAVSWPNFFSFNFMTGKSPTWKRHVYQKLKWTKPSGGKLEMMWRYEQYFYSDQGWLDGAMTREGATGLIRIDISSPAR